MSMTADEAFAAYEAARHRLPQVAPQGAPPRRVGSLADLADAIDVFLLDAFGVLNIGEAAIPGAVARMEWLRGQGKRLMVLTNAASVPTPELVAKYARLGFDFRADEVISSRDCLLAELPGGAGPWGTMLPEGAGTEDLGDLRLARLDLAPAPYAEVSGFLLLGSGGWGAAQQDMLEAALLRHPRPVLVGNPDIVAPRENGFSLEPGHFAHRLADRCGIAPRFFGKPFPGIFREAFRRLGPGLDRARVVMVGDSPHTDILGARAAGVRAALVTGHGFFAGQDAGPPTRRAGLLPDYVMESP